MNLQITEQNLRMNELPYSTINVLDVQNETSSTVKLIYGAKKAINNVTAEARFNALQLSNKSVREQTLKLLDDIDSYLMSATSDILPQIYLTERENSSVLLEWMFEDFRIGFALEPLQDDSYYFRVTVDRVTRAYYSESFYLHTAYNEIIKKIIQFVLQHS
jgi:hypothetical protein